jgi:hypothetical protein
MSKGRDCDDLTFLVTFVATGKSNWPLRPRADKVS